MPEHVHFHFSLPQAIQLQLGSGAGADDAVFYERSALGEHQDGYLLTGEGVPLLTAEHRTRLAEMASALTGKVVQVVARDTEAAELSSTEPELEPIPIKKVDFFQFADRNGYTKARAIRGWVAVARTKEEPDEIVENGRLPPVRFFGFGAYPGLYERGERTLDLRSVHNRLVASEYQRLAWYSTTDETVNFLTHLVNEYMKSEESVKPAKPKGTLSPTGQIRGGTTSPWSTDRSDGRNARQLRDKLADFVNAARRTGGRVKPMDTTFRPAARPAADREQTKAIRDLGAG